MTPRGVRMLQRVTEPPRRRVPVLRGSVVEHLRVAGLPAEWVRGPRALDASAHGDDRAVVLYLHGGGYVFGSPRTHRNLVSRISHVTGLPVLALDYRLPPVATLPAPIEDALAAYRHLLDEGHAPERIVVAGDSAGGHLALTLALHAAEAGLPAPAALILLSPWTDLTMSGDSIVRNATLDPFLPPIALHRAARTALERRRPERLALLAPVRARGALRAAAADAPAGRLDRGAATTTRVRTAQRIAEAASAPSCRSTSASRTSSRCGTARPRRAPRCARSAASPLPCSTPATRRRRRREQDAAEASRARRRRPSGGRERSSRSVSARVGASASADGPRRVALGDAAASRRRGRPGQAHLRLGVQRVAQPRRQRPQQRARLAPDPIRTASTAASRARHGVGQSGSTSGPRRHSA